jgi:hypothetical protein
VSVAAVQQAVSTHSDSASGIWLSARPASSRLLSTRPVSSRLVSPPSVRTRPSPPMLRRWRWGPGRGGRATLTPGTGGGPGGCRAGDGSTTVQEARTRATLPTSGWSVGGRWRTGPPGWVRAGAAALARRATRQARPARGGCIRGVAAVPGWDARPRWVVVAEPAGRVGGPGGPRGGAGGDERAAPARPPAGSERSQLAAGSAVTCDDGWWACQDLNLGPHPYQGSITGLRRSVSLAGWCRSAGWCGAGTSARGSCGVGPRRSSR